VTLKDELFIANESAGKLAALLGRKDAEIAKLKEALQRVERAEAALAERKLYPSLFDLHGTLQDIAELLGVTVSLTGYSTEEIAQECLEAARRRLVEYRECISAETGRVIEAHEALALERERRVLEELRAEQD